MREKHRIVVLVRVPYKGVFVQFFEAVSEAAAQIQIATAEGPTNSSPSTAVGGLNFQVQAASPPRHDIGQNLPLVVQCKGSLLLT